jgi:hypothetical protein
MNCPHCGIAIHRAVEHVPLFEFSENDDEVQNAILGPEMLGFEVDHQECPACSEQIIFLQKGKAAHDHQSGSKDFVGIDETLPFEEFLIWPRTVVRHCPLEVPKHLKEDFLEAAAVLSISPKASAALSRRCLQQILKECAKTNSKDLSKQISEVLASGNISSELGGQLEAVRNIGNFAAHTQKSTNSGEILDVEPEEAEWNLEVIEELFDHYFVKPAKLEKRKSGLNAKLVAAGKTSIS